MCPDHSTRSAGPQGRRGGAQASKRAKTVVFLLRFGSPTYRGLWRARRASRIKSFASEGCPEPVAMSVWSHGGVFGAGLVRQNVRRGGSFFFVARELCLPIATEAVFARLRRASDSAARLRRAPGGLCTFARRSSLKTSKIVDFGRFSSFFGFCIADQSLTVTKNLFCVLGGHFLLCIIFFFDFGVHHL